jgi:ribosomal protein L9
VEELQHLVQTLASHETLHLKNIRTLSERTAAQQNELHDAVTAKEAAEAKTAELEKQLDQKAIRHEKTIASTQTRIKR